MIVFMKRNFLDLTDQELLNQTDLAAKTEKRATLALLQYLCEVDLRKSYAIKAYSSLFEYLVKELGFSESQSSERVNAVRLMRSTPEVKSYLESGKLNLSTASKIQRFVQAEKKLSKTLAPELKTTLIQECLNQSKREVEKILFSHASEPVKIAMKERITQVDQNKVELKIILDEKTEEKLNRAKELIRTETIAELLDQALTALIYQEEKKLGKIEKTVLSEKTVMPKNTISKSTLPATLAKKSNGPNSSKSLNSSSRYIPVQFKKIIFSRSNGQCEYTDPISKRRCKSKSHLEIDHIKPLALNGKTELHNLRHLCRNHNLKSSIEYGLNIDFMKK